VVTIQLPLYNEMYVADRLIDSVCRIQYPRELLEIQVLDDSTDETRNIADKAVRRWAAEGVDIKYIYRVDRGGYKAGALEAGLKVARGEFVAIFDADFIPTPDFLGRLLPYLRMPAGMVRRGRDQSARLRCSPESRRSCRRPFRARARWTQSRRPVLLQRHGGRGDARQSTTPADGNFTDRGLTELPGPTRGWRFVFVPVIAPAEVPVEMNAFKSQHHWASSTRPAESCSRASCGRACRSRQSRPSFTSPISTAS
jgi:glycosyltransferase involved in cell wall biosynthesis